MPLPKELTTVTRTSKILAMLCFIIFPFLGFFLGREYQQAIDSHFLSQSPMSSQSTKVTLFPIDTSNWKTYTNGTYGYSMKYPSSWLVYGPNTKQSIPNNEKSCIQNPLESNSFKDPSLFVIELSKVPLTDCGYFGDQLPSSQAEISLAIYNTPFPNSGNLFPNPIETRISGVLAYKFSNLSQLPTIKATRIYLNYKNHGFIFFLKQINQNSTFDPVDNLILSTFKFIN